METITNKNVQEYIDKGLINPDNIKIDLNTSKTTSDNNHKWITLSEAIKQGIDFNFDYDIKNNKSKIKESESEPITLKELVVTAPLKETEYPTLYDVFIKDNPILDHSRIENINKTIDRNPNYIEDNWLLLLNIGDAINMNSGGWLNRLSPSLNIGLTIDAFKGKDFWDSWFGNSGIAPDKFAQEHPIYTMIINGVFDGATGHGTNKFIKWGNTPRKLNYEGGAEFTDFYKAPFSNDIIKFGEVTPEEIAVRNKIPGMILLKYLGKTPEGLYAYSLKIARIPKTVTKTAREGLYSNLLKDGYKKYLFDEGLGEYNFIKDDTVITDLKRENFGYSNWIDELLLRNLKMIDLGVLPKNEYDMMMETFKKGGKLRKFGNKN